jgi:hypothetical protein
MAAVSGPERDGAAEPARTWSRRQLLRLAAGATIGGGAAALGWRAWQRPAPPPLPPWPPIHLFHPPGRFARRSEALTANVTGAFARGTTDASWRLNGGRWTPIPQGGPRARAPRFVIEIDAGALRRGANTIELRAAAADGSTWQDRRVFAYDHAPIALPLVRSWRDATPEAQDGPWEVVAPAGGAPVVRPAPGWEGYDRLLLVAGSFPGGRRVETTVRLRRHTARPLSTQDWGFGIAPLWGGHPDTSGNRPRAGWRYGLTWFFSRRGGVGVELGERRGAAAHTSRGRYGRVRPVPGLLYNVVAEAEPVHDDEGAPRRWSLRTRWWRADRPMPRDWTAVSPAPTTPEAAVLTGREFAVALIAHRAQVEFGPVSVSALTDRGRG